MKLNFTPAFIKHDQATRARQLPVAFGAALAAVQSPGSAAASDVPSCLLHPGPGTFWKVVKTETIYDWLLVSTNPLKMYKDIVDICGPSSQTGLKNMFDTSNQMRKPNDFLRDFPR
jgi:hypothetical protein